MLMLIYLFIELFLSYLFSFLDNHVIQTRYGSPSGYFESPNWPDDYGKNIGTLYLLYIPGATKITFEFSSPFGIEENKDELYIGAGLEYDKLDGQSKKSIQKYFFEGRNVPPSFTINSNTAWVYFYADKNNNNMTYEGFRVSWTTPPDIIPPKIKRCPPNIVKIIDISVSNVSVSWREPTASDDSGTTVLTLKSHQPKFIFGLGTTTVKYIFSDPSGNTAECSFNVYVMAGESIIE